MTALKKKEKLEFFFDLGSPWSYIAYSQIGALADKNAWEIELRPILLGGLFKSIGSQSPFYEKSDNKRRYFQKDLLRSAELQNIPFKLPSVFPPNSLRAMRGAIVARNMGALNAYAQLMFESYFVHNRDISEDGVVFDVVESLKLDVDYFQSQLDSSEVKKELILATEEAERRGAFGVPTFFVDDEMFFGSDRLSLLERYLVVKRLKSE